MKKWKHSIGIYVLTLLFPTVSKANDCAELIDSLYNHLAASGEQSITVEMMSSKIKNNGFINSSYGRKIYTSNQAPETEFTVPIDMAYSNKDNFSANDQKPHSITFFRNGLVEILHLNNPTESYWLENTGCYSEGIIRGIKREANGLSSVAITVSTN